jgi:nucleoside-diphosphate-sugar epimerase
MTKKQINILVTGAAGNNGTNLCNELCSRGHKVIACDFYNN